MTRKTQDTPSSIRLRENQQRSRARRKDLIESLQKRVQEFELNGVKATQEVQQAARRVVLENERLRSLLALRGVTQVEINSYLHSFDQPSPESDLYAGSANLKTYVPGRAKKVRLRAGPRSNPVSLTLDPVTYISDTRTLSRNDLGDDEHIVVGESQDIRQPCDNFTSEIPNERPLECALRHDQSPVVLTEPLITMAQIHSQVEVLAPTGLPRPQTGVLEKNDTCPSRPDCFCPSTVDLEDASPGIGLDTSCDIAAKIIIDMGGSGGREVVRASLGCASEDECRVKNTTVLQVMGELLN